MITKIHYTDVSAAVTNGCATELVLDQNNNLFLMEESGRLAIFLGDGSKERVKQIIFNLCQIATVLP